MHEPITGAEASILRRRHTNPRQNGASRTCRYGNAQLLAQDGERAPATDLGAGTGASLLWCLGCPAGDDLHTQHSMPHDSVSPAGGPTLTYNHLSSSRQNEDVHSDTGSITERSYPQQ